MKISELARAQLPHRDYTGLLDVLEEFEKVVKEHSLDIPAETMASFHKSFTLNAQRDIDDRARYVTLYGSHELLDYRTPDIYDIR